MTDSERRHYKRIQFIADVILRHNDVQWSCGLEDISLKGMLIVAPEGADPAQGEVYVIELVLGKAATISMQAKISHITDTHWGMQWENIDLDGLTHLRRLLELNMDDPEEMHREMAELG